MQAPGTPSVDQLLVLLTVVEEGSFTGAARRLRRATSAISYAIDTLEAQLGLPLFDRGTTRKPKLTHVGEAIVSEAKAVAYSVETLRARVRGLLDGLESEVSLVVDSIYPSDQLVSVLNDFHTKFPTVPLRLTLQTLEGVERVIRNGDAWIGIGSLLHINSTGLRRTQIGGVPLIPVAAPNHPLALSGDSSASRAREYLQLVLSDQPTPEGRDYGVVSLANWRVGDLTLKHKLLLSGIGWGGMPEPMVRSDIESGRLVRLNLPDWRGGEYAMQVVHKIEMPPGPAGRWLIERLVLSSPPVRYRCESPARPARGGSWRGRPQSQGLRPPRAAPND
ncbi:MAG TPA: LysR family transcriptional regulator [Xanthobacteraceae bacterium]|jgi:DNA-binding transcriptional LysR family regulator|nr:LysR family transcriptional regulator [Xanthobacteraceae bacterium]